MAGGWPGSNRTAPGSRAHFADGTKERGDILIGADGLHSAVRRQILPDGPEPEFTGLIGAGGFVPRSAMMRVLGPEREHAMTFCFGDGAFVGYAFGDRREERGAYWWHSLPRERPLSDDDRQALSGEAGIAALLRAGDGWSPEIRRFSRQRRR